MCSCIGILKVFFSDHHTILITLNVVFVYLIIFGCHHDYHSQPYFKLKSNKSSSGIFLLSALSEKIVQ